MKRFNDLVFTLFAIVFMAALAHAQFVDNSQRLEQLKWQALASAWNPFASKMNAGVFDVKAWKNVVDQVNRIEGKSCR